MYGPNTPFLSKVYGERLHTEGPVSDPSDFIHFPKSRLLMHTVLVQVGLRSVLGYHRNPTYLLSLVRELNRVRNHLVRYRKCGQETQKTVMVLVSSTSLRSDVTTMDRRDVSHVYLVHNKLLSYNSFCLSYENYYYTKLYYSSRTLVK